MGYLVTLFGFIFEPIVKALSKRALSTGAIIASKVILTGFFVTATLSFLAILKLLYEIIDQLIDVISAGGAGGSNCTLTIFWHMLDIMGVIDFVNSILPAFFGTLSALSLMLLQGFIFKSYKQFDKNIVDTMK